MNESRGDVDKFAWIEGNDREVRHRRKIDSGAFADVHEVDVPLSVSILTPADGETERSNSPGLFG